MINKYLTATAAAASTAGGFPLQRRGELQEFVFGFFLLSNFFFFSTRFDDLPAVLGRERAAVIGFSMKDHQRLPGGSAHCSAALLNQPSAPRR